MEYERKCAKCGSAEIVRIPGYPAGDVIQIGWTKFSVVTVTRFMCADCGYVEHWVDSPQDRENVRRKYGSPSDPEDGAVV